MAEGPEVRRIADRLRERLAGKKILTVDAPYRVRARFGERLQRLPGTRVRTARARGKYLLLYFSNHDVLLHHMRVWGHWTLAPPEAKQTLARPRRRLRLVLRANGVCACLWDAPVVELLSSREVENHPHLKTLGPDGLAEPFDSRQFLRRLTDPRRARKEVGTILLDQKVVAGVGNMYRAEILFRCGLDPRTRVGNLDRRHLRRLVRTIPSYLRKVYQHPVWYVPAARRAAGPGRNLLRVYGRDGRPCYRCGTTIRRILQGSWKRVMFYCPGCQTIPSLRIQGSFGSR